MKNNRSIGILRGINVGGKRKIKMADLRQLLTGLGFENIETYIQSGNVVFSGKEEDPVAQAEKISRAIDKKYGFDVPVIVIPSEAFRAIYKANPFFREENRDIKDLHATFLRREARPDALMDLEKFIDPPNEYHFTEKAIYIAAHNGYRNVKLDNGRIEKTLGIPATTRNWKTVRRLYQMAFS